LNAGNAAWDGDAGQAGAVEERCWFDGDDTVGDVYDLHAGIVVEGVRADDDGHPVDGAGNVHCAARPGILDDGGDAVAGRVIKLGLRRRGHQEEARSCGDHVFLRGSHVIPAR